MPSGGGVLGSSATPLSPNASQAATTTRASLGSVTSKPNLAAVSFSLGPALLVIVGMVGTVASRVPAWRAGSIDPARDLRGE
jgi:ABC-type lipoprotein release transport system permease subunit